MKKSMIKVSVLYPNGKGNSFNMDYYCNKHVPMVLDLLGDSVKGGAAEKGLAGSMPGSPPTYLAMGHMYFDTLEDFQTAFGPNADKIVKDFPNFTNTQPVIQISEVMM